MENLIADLSGKRALVLSDHRELSTVIELNLSGCLGTEVVKVGPGSPEQWRDPIRNGNVDLIVVALSSPANEPVVALARASLTERIGQVPILIISDRPFDSDPKARIFCLDFPFEVDGLRDKVREILQTCNIKRDTELALCKA